jgi:hypothetical protein
MTMAAVRPGATSPPAPGRVPSTSLRRTALVAGALYLITFAASIAALPLLAPVLNDPNYIAGSGADTRVLLGWTGEQWANIAVTGVIWLLAPMLVGLRLVTRSEIK